MNVDRREALKTIVVGSGAAAGGLALGCEKQTAPGQTGGEAVPVLSADGLLYRVLHDQMEETSPRAVDDPAVRQGDPGRKYVMVLDLAKCAGLKKCTAACQAMHYTPSTMEYIRVYTMQDADETAPSYFPRPCFHCDNPPCTKVCPVDATFKRSDGIVHIDNERCIGCRFCMAACPYSARSFNWGEPEMPLEAAKKAYSPETGVPPRRGTVAKCDFCPEMARMGELPFCVQACPNGVIYYGDENEDAVTNGLGETVQLSKLLRDRAGYRFMEELGTKPRVYYLPPKDRRFDVPENGGRDELITDRTESGFRLKVMYG